MCYNGLMQRKTATTFLVLAATAVSLHAAPGLLREHAFYDAVPLDGAWEMAYRPYAHETPYFPSFAGVVVPNAIPGYWEDMVPAFRAAGMKDEFRTNPFHDEVKFPRSGWTPCLTLPDIYGCFYYRRTVDLDRAGRAVLAFEGVRNQVHAWVNGKFAGFHAGFSTPFELNVRDGLLKKGRNEIVLAVSNNRNLGYCDYVSGLTTRAIFIATGGVNGRLELRFPHSDIGDVFVTTAKDLKTFTIGMSGAGKYAYEIADGGKMLLKGEAKGDATLPTDGLEFWSPENPKRYRLALKTPQGGTYSQMFGLRRLVAAGEKFLLNGKPVYLRGVTEHCYFPETLHLPRDVDYYRRITQKRKEFGFNFVRFHTYVPPAEYLDAMDELGMLVHIESPNFVSVPEYASIIAFARRHPCVVIYCTGNETRIDRMAETYLENVARHVHARTDSLFSPMSALRGVEYALSNGNDPTVPHPFRHNAERMARLAKYSDLFSSYQLGATSYDSLDGASAAAIDAWGDAYCGKPRVSHEICIDGSYFDFSTEALYPTNSPVVKAGLFAEPRRALAEKGLLDRADAYFRNSGEWMWRIRKFCFEKIRSADRVAGFDFLGDINGHWHTFGYSSGMMDEFLRLKPGETRENVLRYNSAAVLLTDLGSDFNFVAGAKKKVAFSISNYAADAKDARLDVWLEEDGTGRRAWSASRRFDAVANGCLTQLGSFDMHIPQSDVAGKYWLKANFAAKGVKAENRWEIYAFPKVAKPSAPANVRIVQNISEAQLAAAMENGERVLLLGAGPFRSFGSSYRIGLAGRASGNYATVIKKGHPALDGMPHEGFCGWQFRRLIHGGRTVQLEGDVPFDPIIDVASSEKLPIRQAALFEYRVGKGRLLVCSFAFREDDPAAAWLRERLVAYAASDAFMPQHSIALAQLHSTISAPLATQTGNANAARNPTDSAGDVRAGPAALP